IEQKKQEEIKSEEEEASVQTSKVNKSKYVVSKIMNSNGAILVDTESMKNTKIFTYLLNKLEKVCSEDSLQIWYYDEKYYIKLLHVESKTYMVFVIENNKVTYDTYEVILEQQVSTIYKDWVYGMDNAFLIKTMVEGNENYYILLLGLSKNQKILIE